MYENLGGPNWPFYLFVVMQCRDPGIPQHSVRQGNSFTFESVLTYQCDVGYIRHGAATLVCGQSGRWTSKPPTCERKCQFMRIRLTKFCFLLQYFAQN